MKYSFKTIESNNIDFPGEINSFDKEIENYINDDWSLVGQPYFVVVEGVSYVFQSLMKADSEPSRLKELCLPVDSLNISTRTKNILKSMEIYIINDLLKCTRKILSENPNLGNKSLAEIEDSLAEKGLHLGMKK